MAALEGGSSRNIRRGGPPGPHAAEPVPFELQRYALCVLIFSRCGFSFRRGACAGHSPRLWRGSRRQARARRKGLVDYTPELRHQMTRVPLSEKPSLNETSSAQCLDPNLGTRGRGRGAVAQTDTAMSPSRTRSSRRRVVPLCTSVCHQHGPLAAEVGGRARLCCHRLARQQYPRCCPRPLGCDARRTSPPRQYGRGEEWRLGGFLHPPPPPSSNAYFSEKPP